MPTQTTFQIDRAALKITVARVIDASPADVWKALTDPALIPQWWGPSYLTTRVETLDVKKGGAWRVVQEDPEGETHPFNGVYSAVEAPRCLVRTFNYEPIGPGHEMTEMTVLEELKGERTQLTTVSTFKTLADLNGMVGDGESGMESGAVESFERLAELLKEPEGF